LYTALRAELITLNTLTPPALLLLLKALWILMVELARSCWRNLCEWRHLLDLDALTAALGGIRKASTSDLTNPMILANETIRLLNRIGVRRQETLYKFFLNKRHTPGMESKNRFVR
jgi:hypothetical protein